ncbi:hypothetical protein [Halopiger aswanensis]|uniref:DUF8128 domain-containing protein n=1 Tax=Halopiger aswanensis TaxID=148449 RepID=A0A3R7DAK7_9EURY|nr:hypothetical protein [Halopiger aswanensis]RKD95637.1 hypothetical protein ATJ93_2498 [Halopiger aswanensis]
MNLLKQSYTVVDEDQAERLQHPGPDCYYPVEIHPPRDGDVPSTVDRFVRGILEIQTKLLKTSNVSPLIAYEIRRPNPDQLRLQFCTPTKRLDRKVRTHLSNTVSGIGFDTGVNGLPVLPEDTVGGGILTTGRKDRFPLRTDFDSPPINSLVAALHRHAMMNTRIVVQILFQPIAGRSLKEWWRKRRAYQTAGFLRKEKEKLWGSRSATPREQSQADLVERKAGTRGFYVSIRFAVISAGEYTASRVKELAGAFNIYENPESGQYLNATPVKSRRQKHLLGLNQAIADREFGGYSHRFRVSTEELAGLVSVPDRNQQNLETAL